MNLAFPRNPQYEFELLRVMGQTPFGAAEIGECLATASRGRRDRPAKGAGPASQRSELVPVDRSDPQRRMVWMSIQVRATAKSVVID
jgi:hypothetical protein